MPLETCVFVVRLWREETEQPDSADAWRGSVEQVATGQPVYFRSLATLVALLARRSGFPHPEP